METYGSYQLLKRLATGGMAEIFLARQQGPEGFEKLLVLKRILPHLSENEDFIKMFLDEARIAARLNHSNLVQIFNLGEQDHTYFIAMEYIHGEDVRRVWKRAESFSKELPVPLVCRIVMEVCAGLDYAHKKTDTDGRPLALVHRDISPQNIIVTFEGGVKVVDFGIAKAADQSAVTRSGVLKGKYSYMSPEQAAGERLDGRSDIFALGVVMYELLTAARLFKRPTDIQTINAVIACEVMPPSQVNSRCPEDLDPIVMKALAARPDDRYQHALELQVALEQWLLRNQLPSSSAQLGAFLKEIYAARLAEEAQAGGPVFEEGALQRRDDDPPEAPKQKPAKRAVTDETAAAHPSPAAEETRVRPPGAKPSAREAHPRAAYLPSPHLALDAPSVTIKDTGGPPALRPKISVVRVPPRKRKRWGLAVAAAGLVLLGGVAWAWWASPKALAVIHVATEPAGATVLFDGHPVPETTPCTLPTVRKGAYILAVGKAGFVDQRFTVTVPETGEVTLPLIRLETQSTTLDPP